MDRTMLVMCQLVLAQALVASSWAPSSVAVEAETVEVKAESVRLYAEPNVGSQVLAIVKKGAVLNVLDSVPGWYRVSAPVSGYAEWVRKIDLQAPASTASVPTPPPPIPSLRPAPSAPPARATSASAPTRNPPAAVDLEAGIAQVNEGDLQNGIRSLDGVINKLTPDAESHKEALSRAHLFKGVACVGLAQEEPAKASFREALRYDPSLVLSETQFSPRVVRVFEAARKGKTKPVLYAAGGVSVVGIAALVVAASAAAEAGVVGAGIANNPSPSPMPTPRPTQTFSNSLPAGNCTDSHSFTMSVAGRAKATLANLSGAAQAEVLLCESDGCKSDRILGVGQQLSAELVAGENSVKVRCGRTPFEYTVQVLLP